MESVAKSLQVAEHTVMQRINTSPSAGQNCRIHDMVATILTSLTSLTRPTNTKGQTEYGRSMKGLEDTVARIKLL